MIFLTRILEINRGLGLGEYPVQGQEKVVEMWKEREEHKKSGQQIGSTMAGKTVIYFCFPSFRLSVHPSSLSHSLETALGYVYACFHGHGQQCHLWRGYEFWRTGEGMVCGGF